MSFGVIPHQLHGFFKDTADYRLRILILGRRAAYDLYGIPAHIENAYGKASSGQTYRQYPESTLIHGNTDGSAPLIPGKKTCFLYNAPFYKIIDNIRYGGLLQPGFFRKLCSGTDSSFPKKIQHQGPVHTLYLFLIIPKKTIFSLHLRHALY